MLRNLAGVIVAEFERGLVVADRPLCQIDTKDASLWRLNPRLSVVWRSWLFGKLCALLGLACRSLLDPLAPYDCFSPCSSTPGPWGSPPTGGLLLQRRWMTWKLCSITYW